TSRLPGPGHSVSSLSGRRDGATTWLFDTDSFAPTAKIKNGKTYSIVTDHLGTPGQMYKDDGGLFWEAELDSYGKVRVERGEAGSCPFRYQGQYEDVETGLYYNRFRYYSAEEGMYVSQDPIAWRGGIRLFSYVDDPIIFIDIFGLHYGKPIRNAHLAGKKHPITGVPFNKKGFPDFRNHLYPGGKNDVRIKPTGNRDADFAAANKKAGYDSTPKGYTWHHHETDGRMQLVESKVHSKTGHTGGFSLHQN
ncbi:MAG: HNH endonuclease, partial [Bacteroidetes bacterium]|nr:HNH endonuclease [Bacteroidota bacterium]